LSARFSSAALIRLTVTIIVFLVAQLFGAEEDIYVGVVAISGLQYIAFRRTIFASAGADTF
jgi:hypothetical protein